MTKNSSFHKNKASGEVQLEGGVGAIRTKVQQLQLARLGCPPSACLPAAGPEAPRMRNGKLGIARAQEKARRIWRTRTMHLTRHGAYELTRPDHEENACHQV